MYNVYVMFMVILGNRYCHAVKSKIKIFIKKGFLMFID